MTNNDKNYQHIVLKVLEAKPVAFNPVLARIVGSVKAGLFLSQLLYWWTEEKDKNEWVCKTIKEVEEETALSRASQDFAIARLKKMNLIESCVRGFPQKRMFRPNIKKIIEMYKLHIDRNRQNDTL